MTNYNCQIRSKCFCDEDDSEFRAHHGQTAKNGGKTREQRNMFKSKWNCVHWIKYYDIEYVCACINTRACVDKTIREGGQ